MEETKTKEKVLKRVRQALIHKTENRFPKLDFDSSVFKASDDPLELYFAQELIKVNGKFIYCENEQEFCSNIKTLTAELKFKQIFCNEIDLMDHLRSVSIPFLSGQQDLVTCDTTITGCEALVSRTGSVIVSSKQKAGRRGAVFPDHHIVVARTSQLVADLKDIFLLMKQRYGDQLPSMITTITGPSRTADIEKTLVQGAHGAKEIYVFLIDDSVN